MLRERDKALIRKLLGLSYPASPKVDDAVEAAHQYAAEQLINRQKEITEEWFGPRCEQYEPACYACKAWARTDLLIDLIDDQYHARKS